LLAFIDVRDQKVIANDLASKEGKNVRLPLHNHTTATESIYIFLLHEDEHLAMENED
jgi:hypothetical protein